MAKKKAEESTIEEKLNNALIPVDKQPYKIPQNWCWVNWISVGNLISGNGFPNKYQGFKEYNIPFYKVGSLKFSDINGYIFDNENTINNDIFTELKCNLIPVNSILFAKIGEAIKLNRRSINERPCCIDNNMMAFVPKCCNFKYGYYWLTTINLYKYAKATIVPALRKIELDKIPFPLPPLAEQERIVNKLDNYISKLNEAKEKLEKVIDSYNYRKNLILHRAFTGQLTKNWREKNKFELDDDIKNKAITKDSMLPDEYLYEIPENWRWVRLGEININVIDGDRGKNYPKKKKEFFSEGYCIFLNAKNVTKDGFKFDNLEYITKDKDELLRSGRLNRGDIVMTTRGTIGNIALYDDSIIYDKLRINSGMVIFRSEFEIAKKYIIYLWQSILIKNQINILTTGTAQPQLPIKDLKKIHFPLPPIEEQKEIVKILDSFLTKEKQVKEIAEKEIERLENLKENLLTRAFGGILGTNNPNEENSIELLKTVL